MRFILALFLLIALFLEVAVTTLPLILIILLCFIALTKDNFIFFLAFIAGILLDGLTFKPLGLSSIYLTAFLFIVLMYQDKFEITTNYFILIFSFLGSFGFLLILGYNSSVILEPLTSALLAVLLFIFLKHFIKLDIKSSGGL